jgi:hypothetical protein
MFYSQWLAELPIVPNFPSILFNHNYFLLEHPEIESPVVYFGTIERADIELFEK